MGERSRLARMMSWVRALVWVIQQLTCAGCCSRLPRKDITGKGVSPGCSVITEKSTERPSMRGGVPVFSRDTRSGSSRRRWARAMAGGSPARPPLWFCRSDVDKTTKEGPGSQHHVVGMEFQAHLGDHAGDAIAFDDEVVAACWNIHRFG